MLQVTPELTIPDEEIELSAMRSGGKGGQNVNKVSSAIHLRFDIKASSLPFLFKHRLLRLRDGRITDEGIIVIKAQSQRSQEQNKADALERLAELVRGVTVTRAVRKPTKPSKGAKRRRVDDKKRRGEVKALRGKIV